MQNITIFCSASDTVAPIYKNEAETVGQWIGTHHKTLVYGGANGGACSRSFYVGEDITEEDIKAEFKHGLLKLFVPKKEAKPASRIWRIKIKEGNK